MNSKYAQYFAIEAQMRSFGHKCDREDLIHDYTDGKHSSLRQLHKDGDYIKFIAYLNQLLEQLKTDVTSPTKKERMLKMRRKMIALFVHKMGYNMKELDDWCQKYGPHHLPMNLHNYQQLIQLVSVAEKVYSQFIEKLDSDDQTI